MKKGLLILILVMTLTLFGCEFPTGSTTPKKESFEIAYMLNGGSFDVAPKESYSEGEEYTFPTPVYEKHAFLGWFDMITDEEKAGITKTDTGNITVYAKWEKLDVYCTITYHTNGGVLPDGATTSYKEGEYVGLVRPTREGYLFRGWYKDSAFTKAYNTISKEDTGDVTVYAKWDEFKMENIRFGILGDSVSTYYDQFDPNSSIFGGDNQFYYPKYCSTVTSSSMCWWMKAINRLGATMMINNSYSGGTVLGSGMSSALNDQRLLKFLKNNEYPDITFILLGVNDALGGSSKATFKDGYERMLNKLMRYYPGMQLFICLLPYETYSDGVYRELYNEALREIASEYQLPIVDFTTAWNATTEQKNNWYYLNDNIHPNDKGMAVMGNIAYQAVIDYYHLGE